MLELVERQELVTFAAVPDACDEFCLDGLLDYGGFKYSLCGMVSSPQLAGYSRSSLSARALKVETYIFFRVLALAKVIEYGHGEV